MTTLLIGIPVLRFDSNVYKCIQNAFVFSKTLESASSSPIICNAVILHSDLSHIYSKPEDLFDNLDCSFISSFVYSPPKGVYHAFNTILSLADSDFLFIHGSDDCFILDNLDYRLISRQLTTYSNKSVVFHSAFSIGTNFSHSRESSSFSSLFFNIDKMRFAHFTMFASRDVYMNFPSYSLGFGTTSDYEYFLRLKLSGVLFRRLSSRPLIFHRLGGVSTVSSKSVLQDYLFCTKAFLSTYGFVLAPLFIIARFTRFFLGLVRLVVLRFFS